MTKEADMSAITLVYRKGWYARLRELRIFADDSPICAIKQGDEVEVELPEGAVHLFGKMDWAKTERFALKNISNGDRLILVPYFTINPLRMLGIMPMPIRIERG